MADQARADLAGFLLNRTEGRPLVTLKVASSLDGRIATETGDSRWITGPEARRRVHALRLVYDAVLIGGGTARADDPLLTVRDMGAVRQPVRVVLSAGLDLPEAGALVGSIHQAPLWILHSPDASEAACARWSARGARLIPVATPGRQIDMTDALRTLARAGLTRIFCEGGGQVAASLLAAGLVDRIVVHGAGVVLGAGGTPSVAGLAVLPLADHPRWRLESTRILGPDVETVWSRL